MSAPAQVLNLIERFGRNCDDYRKGHFNETQLRIEYLNPIFELLGWDVNNRKGYAENYRDVIHEDQIKIGGMTKAPDYCFRVGPERKFSVEAKRPSVNIKDDTAPAFQLRRYAWSAKLPLSILTDFEEFAVYDCRIKPDRLDRASVARILYFPFDSLPEKWEEFSSIFSKEAVLQGSFDRFAASARGKRGTAQVDDAFLEEIESWRESLALNLARRNPLLTQPELNDAVQRTIDRIIFLRICEDRGIEEYGRLQGLRNGANIYPRLVQLFHEADLRYNSGLFHFRTERGQGEVPDELTPDLAIDDKVLKDILRRLYYPDSPYEFSVFSGSILGQVYEQFLGKVILLDDRHRAAIEEKPEVRKAGGVYYTPEYIATHIVENTVGELLKGKTPKEVANLRILDPACGSGSFLLVAYGKLLDWHLRWYCENSPEKWAARKDAPIYQIPYSGAAEDLFTPKYSAWRLTTAEKKRILLNNLYGVDIDQQAVEVTKLSLMLRMLEGENEQTLGRQMRFLHDRVLPDLGGNIKCGNSLIGRDFYNAPEKLMLSMDAKRRINAFDWSDEFSKIMSTGGFDAVIGNPPYIRIQAMKEWAPIEVEFYKERYISASKGNYDIYVVFVEKGLSLLNNKGRLGYILPHKFFSAKYGEPLRGLIAKGKYLSEIVHFGHQQVFADATTYTCLLFLDKKEKEKFEFLRVDDLSVLNSPGTRSKVVLELDQTSAREWSFEAGRELDVIRKCRNAGPGLGDVATIFQGLVTGADKVFIISSVDSAMEMLRPFLSTGKLKPYSAPAIQSAMVFPYRIDNGRAKLLMEEELRQKAPETWRYLQQNERGLRRRENGKWEHEGWYAFGRSQNLAKMDAPKLIIQVTALQPTVILDEDGLYMTGGGSGPFYGIRPVSDAVSLRYLMGILNSRVFGFLVAKQSTVLRGGYVKYSKQYIEHVPIPMIDVTKGLGQERYTAMINLVDQMLALHKQLAATKIVHDRAFLERQIAQTALLIDQLTYALYNLSDDDIKVVEKHEDIPLADAQLE